MSTNTPLRHSGRQNRPASRFRCLGLLTALTLLAIGCSGGPDVGTVQRSRIPAQAPYLLVPTQGYDLSLSAADQAVLDSAHKALVESSSTENARQVSADLLRRNPDLDPATLLVAQAALIEGDLDLILTSLPPVLARIPTYDAANMVYGRAAELSGLFAEAMAAYGAMADRSQLAASRFEAVRPRAVEFLSMQVDEALTRQRLDSARSNLALLERWAPRDISTLKAAIAVAVAQKDLPAELEALRALAAVTTLEEPGLTRRARLELEIGDAGTGLRIIQDLANAQPGNARLAAELARAKFLWRLELLPEKVRQLAREPELHRGDLAAMLYWLFPSVRYGRAETGRIANDVLNHPHRQEIVRVANLGIMGVDARLHRFEPDRVLSRAATMVPILRILGRQRPLPACLAGHDVASRMSSSLACELAARCGLLDEDAECLPGAPASGGAAIEWTRRALDNLGVE